MATLADHTNVFNTALLVLQQKGYQLWHDAESHIYYAEKDGWDFASSSPVGLLGVVAIYDFLQPQAWKEYWWRLSDETLYRRLPGSPPQPYEPVYIRKRSEP